MIPEYSPNSPLLCLCGRTFLQVPAFGNHQRNCAKSKRKLSGALTKAKELWVAKKRRRLEGPEPGVENTQTSIPIPGVTRGSSASENLSNHHVGLSKSENDA